MNQLSTKAANEKPIIIKNIRDEINRISIYHLTKKNNSFKQLIHQVLSIVAMVSTNHNVEELRQIAILMNKMIFIQTHSKLWTTYLKSGIGQLMVLSQEQFIYPTNISI